ncbi:hypothetical protein JX266_014380, partial [Neoarthrinium moseri]
MVWKQVWPVVKERVLSLSQLSLDTGELPHQWRLAKIIPLKKAEKPDYAKAKAWRPTSMLSTLGKILESVIAERLSYLVETMGLLPTNHFGRRKQRSAEQALMLLQEWVESFCSDRTASIVVNGETSDPRALPQAGLPQGSPLSPILFLFFNADLVQRKFTASGGSVAFIDDYTAWTVGESAAVNRAGIEDIIGQAVAWASRSGASVETDKTAVIHFTRNSDQTDDGPFTIGGVQVEPKDSVNILGIVMDRQLRFKEQLANAATKGLKAAMALRRLRLLAPKVARQLFVATVTPAVDYGSNVWAHTCTGPKLRALERIQKTGGQAITGAFNTVALAVVEAEASILSTHERFKKKALKAWIAMHTLPKTHPLSRLPTRPHRRFMSPVQKMAQTCQGVAVDRLETVRPHVLAPWEARIPTTTDVAREQARDAAERQRGIIISTSSSQRNNLVGIGFALRDRDQDDS